ncbi:hypothetical protein ACP4OV_013622 [Aristida adscensionis]
MEHQCVISLLKGAMRCVAAKLLAGWSIDWEGAEARVFDCNYLGFYSETERKNRSGVLVAYFCRNYDGDVIRAPACATWRDSISEVASFMFAEISGLEENHGCLTTDLINSLTDSRACPTGGSGRLDLTLRL